MVIEKFYPGKVKLLYERFDKKGRLLPEGVNYVNSWIDENITICYQLMESDTAEKIHRWIENWIEFAEFEVIPVITSAAAREKIFS